MLLCTYMDITISRCPRRSSRGVVPRSYFLDVESSASTESDGISGPYSQHQINLDNLCAKPISQVEGPQEVRQEKSTTNDVPLSDHCLSPSHGLNVTEFARALQDDSDDDPDEVESAPDPSHDIVHGYRVKIEIAHLLRDIFKKYGDITVDANVKCHYPSIISFFLERLCAVFQRLEKTKLSDLTLHEINEMIGELQCIESQNINAKWLLEKVQEISEARTNLKKYMMFEDEAEKYIQSNDSIHKEVEV
ncbi:hypothetical protein C2S51_016232 [Perilla frutescens var. frutescens]|nr:hypothetical protein C2S51_016232 [Perilla frutescens var. frutescens]